MPASPSGPGLIAVLGASQVVGFGTIYYAYPVLVPGMAQDFGVSEATLYGMFSAGLFVSGLTAPLLGGLMDRFQAPRVMTAGSLAVAALLGGLALAPGPVSFAALVVVLQAVAFAVLYDAAFATLALRRPGDTRRAISRLTLIAGFASTLFWPLTGWLAGTLGWRGTWALYALLNLALVLPLHLWLCAPPRAGLAPAAPVPAAPLRPLPPALAAPLPPGPLADRAFGLLAVGFALTGMVISALALLLVPVLIALGLGETAYIVGMAMGPAQVAIRLVDATLWRHWHPMRVALVSAGTVVLAIAALLLPGPPLVAALAFVILFGAGHGLSSIVRGALPIALFGTAGLGRRLGRLARLRIMLAALAPFLFALAEQRLGVATALALTAAIGLAGLWATWRLQVLLRQA